MKTKVSPLIAFSTAGLLFLARIACVSAAEESKDSTPVMLPAFVVADSAVRAKDLSDWQYISHPNFEILSNCWTKIPKEMAASLPDCLELMRLFMPVHLTRTRKAPLILIIDSRPSRQVIPGGNQEFFVTPENAKVSGPIHSRAYGDDDCLVIYINVGDTNDSDAGIRDFADFITRLVFSGILQKSITEASPPPPPWLPGALQWALFVPSPPPPHSASMELRGMLYFSTNENTKNNPVLSLEKVFNSRFNIGGFAPPNVVPTKITFPAKIEPTSFNAEIYTAALFVRWALFSENGKHADAFWSFVNQLRAESRGGEELFQRCFGLNYSETEQRLRDYRRDAAKPVLLNFSAMARPSISPSDIRNATVTEASRITAEWARLAAIEWPSLRESLFAQGRHILEEHASESGRDPRYLATYGILLSQSGDYAAAIPLLESAAGKVDDRPGVYTALAKARLARLIAANPGKKLSAAQLAPVLEPLAMAYKASHEQAAFYDVFLDLWENAESKPQLKSLSPLLEGVRLYPYNTTLAWRAAKLYADMKFNAPASSLCDSGSKFAKDEATREKFEKFKATLVDAEK
ncbi:MAG TPA: hypothetical protein VHD62_05230 [Opitutaceae bacterium]|nr:hypothetical protein [Opitutaceae bacterium]